MSPDYLRHVIEGNFRVPNVVGIDKDDRPFVMPPGASVPEHSSRRKTITFNLFPEPLKQFTAALFTAATFSGGGANKDLT